MSGQTRGLSSGDPSRAAPRRRVAERALLPSGRAVVGGLLLALSGLGTFTAWQQASGTPDTSYVVTRRAIAPGQRIAADDVRLVALDLSTTLAGSAYRSPDGVVGHVTLGPLGEGELLQAGQISPDSSTGPQVEMSFAVPTDRALDGSLLPGDRVDVFTTYDGQTQEVAAGLEVVRVTGGSGLGGGEEQTITVALDQAEQRIHLVHAVRAGEVTLVRSTLAAGGEGS